MNNTDLQSEGKKKLVAAIVVDTNCESNVLKLEYGYINELGFIFIPNSFQESSNFKSANHYPRGSAQEISMKVTDKGIMLSTIIDDESFYKDIPEEKAGTYTYINENGEKISKKKFGKVYPVIDEFGRLVLPKKLRQQANISDKGFVQLCLIDEENILIRKASTVVYSSQS